jgi:hypothetical protein
VWAHRVADPALDLAGHDGGDLAWIANEHQASAEVRDLVEAVVGQLECLVDDLKVEGFVECGVTPGPPSSIRDCHAGDLHQVTHAAALHRARYGFSEARKQALTAFCVQLDSFIQQAQQDAKVACTRRVDADQSRFQDPGGAGKGARNRSQVQARDCRQQPARGVRRACPKGALLRASQARQLARIYGNAAAGEHVLQQTTRGGHVDQVQNFDDLVAQACSCLVGWGFFE